VGRGHLLRQDHAAPGMQRALADLKAGKAQVLVAASSTD
jgi:hypothetical protein